MTKYTKKLGNRPATSSLKIEETITHLKIAMQLSWQTVLRKVIFLSIFSAPIVFFIYTFAISNRHGILYGDWDYFAQLYEAARQSILTYHQFPWWNPWVIGGVPLYANPQFGLISIQMPLVLIFGTLVGLHLAILIYYVFGFWGMYCLLARIGAQRSLSLLLAYIWVFGSFPAWHIAGGHLTFAVYLLAPWLFLTLLNLRRVRFGWLWLGLFAAFLINQTMHYSVIQMFFVAGIYACGELFIRWREKKLANWQIIKPYLLALGVIIVLAGPRLFFTLQYLHHFTRIPAVEHANSSGLVIDSLTLRQAVDPIQTFHAQFGWSEYTAYYGILTLMLLVYLIFRSFELKKIEARQWWLIGGMIFFLLLALGPFSSFSPYSLMKDLPVFQQMQVASRWLGWFGLLAILFLARLPKKPFVYIILGLSVLDVGLSSRAALNYAQAKYQPPTNRHSIIDQQAFYQNQPDIRLSSLRFLNATQSNVGDVFGYEPLGEFSIVANDDFSHGLTIRCGSNQTDCPFVLSKNAVVTKWTPQKFELKRSSSGKIELNMNPGNNWYENGKLLFGGQKEFELKERFIIKDPAETIVVEYRPHL